MKNGRTISLREPKLQKIRNNLRLIILKEASKRKKELSNQKHRLTHDKDGNYFKISDETSNLLRSLTDKWWEIERPLRASIIKCATCSKHNRDMTYHRKSQSWYCVDCFKKNFR
jgi:hypothetical protein